MPALPTFPPALPFSLPAFPPPLSGKTLPRPLRRTLLGLGERLESYRPPDFRVPPTVAAILQRLPSRPPTWALTTALNFALDRILPREPLLALRTCHLQLRVIDAGLKLDFTLVADLFRPLHAASDARPDLVISATTRDFIALALREEDPDTLFFNRRLRMEGDTDLGLLVKNTLDAIDWQSWKDRFADQG
ncbi:MAG: SCP2 sterol-binding domain-containing protein [Thauera sp.]|nr:SCP2 sterol-binding domain-containing protein [Thauera sp.]